MKIREILSEAILEPEVTIDDPLSEPYDKYAMKRKRDAAGLNQTGWYSKGSPGDDPHEYKVTTWLPTDLTLDAKHAWYKTIKPYIGENPYLPNYYRLNLKPDSEGEAVAERTMETLYDIDSLIALQLSFEPGRVSMNIHKQRQAHENADKTVLYQLVIMANNMFGEERFDYELEKDSNEAAKTFWHSIVTDINSEFVRPGTFPNLDPYLKQALELVKKTIETKPTVFEEDLHSGNFLIRKTSVGLQFVVADPVSDGGRSILEPQ